MVMGMVRVSHDMAYFCNWLKSIGPRAPFLFPSTLRLLVGALRVDSSSFSVSPFLESISKWPKREAIASGFDRTMETFLSVFSTFACLFEALTGDWAFSLSSSSQSDAQKEVLTLELGSSPAHLYNERFHARTLKIIHPKRLSERGT